MQTDISLVVDPFWDTNLDVLEKDFLGSGRQITDLPLYFDSKVPSQGSVLLPQTKSTEIELSWSARMLKYMIRKFR